MTKTTEQLLIERPDDDELWAVYADELEAAGDSRGLLAAIQLADGELISARQRELLASEPSLVPSLLAIQLAAYESRRPAADASDHAKHTWDEDEVSVRWHAGFIRHALLARGDPDYPVPLGELVADVLDHPSGKFIRDLVIGPYGEYGEYEYQDVVDAIAAQDRPALRSLRIAEFAHAHSEVSWVELGDLSAMWPRLANLETLFVRGGTFELGTLELLNLRAFSVETSGLSADSIESIVNATWPRLEILELYFGSEEYGSEGSIESIQPILDARGLENVTALGLENAEFADEIAKALPASKIAAQVERLALGQGTMTAEGAKALVAGAASFPNLVALDLDGNHIDDDAVALVREAFPFVDVGYQGDMEFRYVKLGE